VQKTKSSVSPVSAPPQPRPVVDLRILRGRWLDCSASLVSILAVRCTPLPFPWIFDEINPFTVPPEDWAANPRLRTLAKTYQGEPG